MWSPEAAKRRRLAAQTGLRSGFSGWGAAGRSMAECWGGLVAGDMRPGLRCATSELIVRFVLPNWLREWCAADHLLAEHERGTCLTR